MGQPRTIARVVTALLLASCGGTTGPRDGTAITIPNGNAQILKLRVGQQFSYDEIFLQNESDVPITLKSVELLPDARLGGRIDTITTVVAPLHTNRDTTPGGIWLSFPPTVQVFHSGPCVTQHIEPLDGYVLRPGGQARVIVVMKVAMSGSYRARGNRVTYVEGGDLRIQFLPNEFKGTITDEGPTDLELADIEKACAPLGNLLTQVG
jgi:hypothetical protein